MDAHKNAAAQRIKIFHLVMFYSTLVFVFSANARVAAIYLCLHIRTSDSAAQRDRRSLRARKWAHNPHPDDTAAAVALKNPTTSDAL